MKKNRTLLQQHRLLREASQLLTIAEKLKTEKPETADAQGMSNDMILKLYEQGLSKVEIAKQLGRGLGEVNLVIELYKGDENL